MFIVYYFTFVSLVKCCVRTLSRQFLLSLKARLLPRAKFRMQARSISSKKMLDVEKKLFMGKIEVQSLSSALPRCKTQTKVLRFTRFLHGPLFSTLTP